MVCLCYLSVFVSKFDIVCNELQFYVFCLYSENGKLEITGDTNFWLTSLAREELFSFESAYHTFGDVRRVGVRSCQVLIQIYLQQE